MKQVLAESKINIGDFYFHKRRNFTAARVFYNEAITSYPDSSVAARAGRNSRKWKRRPQTALSRPGKKRRRRKSISSSSDHSRTVERPPADACGACEL